MTKSILASLHIKNRGHAKKGHTSILLLQVIAVYNLFRKQKIPPVSSNHSSYLKHATVICFMGSLSLSLFLFIFMVFACFSLSVSPIHWFGWGNTRGSEFTASTPTTTLRSL